MLSIDTNDLPVQFSSPRESLSVYAQPWWDNFASGTAPDSQSLQQIPAYKAVWDLYCEHTGTNRSELQEAVADKYRAEATIRRIAMQNPNRVSLNQSQVTQAVKTSLDVYHTGEAQPSISIVRDLLPGKEVKPVMTRPQQRKRMKKALRANADHPAVVTAQKQGNPIRMDADTLSSGLMSLQNAAMVVRKLNEHEQRLANMEARMKELEAFKANTEQRNIIEDEGQDPRELARALRAAGKSLGDIAKATGRSRSTIQRWVG